MATKPSIWRAIRRAFDSARTASGWCGSQKTGAGFQDLFLYRRNGFAFSSATPKSLSDMAWDYFWGSPASKKLHRNPKDRDELSHVFAALVKGMDDNYAWLGQHWPDSRYVVISLNFDAQGEDKPKPYIRDWWCAYDLKTGTFTVPACVCRAQRQGLHDPSPQAAIEAQESRFSDRRQCPGPAAKRWYRRTKSVCCSPKPPRRPQDNHVQTGRRPAIRENSFESHRQFYSQGQRHRARRQALCGSDRREHPSRQGNPGQPDRNAPHRRRGEDLGALQDHRPGREGDDRGSQLQLSL